MDIVPIMQAIGKLAEIPGFESIVLGKNNVIAIEEYFNDGGADILLY